MAERIYQRVGDEEACVYLEDRRARIQHKVIEGCEEATYQGLLEHGWRRFGRVFYRPVCSACTACTSLRVDVAEFRPNRSMRRTARRNRDLRVILERPALSAEHLGLYRRYHRAQEHRHGWPAQQLSPIDYHRGFIDGEETFGRELRLLDGERLLAVALVDLLPAALSAVYCFYEPDQRHRGLGVYAILQQIALARRRGIPYVYLGYWVAENASMRYKADYRPHQVLRGRPRADRRPTWQPGEARSRARRS